MPIAPTAARMGSSISQFKSNPSCFFTLYWSYQ